MNALIKQMEQNGYTRIARFNGSQQAETEQYLEAIRHMPNYIDHALIYTDDGNAVLLAKKLDPHVTDLPYRDPIVARVDKQSNKGIMKYGKLLHDNNLNAVARLEYMAEELTDGLVYIEHAKAGLYDVFDTLAGLIGRLMMVAAVEENEDKRLEITSIAGEANKLLGKVMGYEDNEQGREEGTR